MRTTTRTTIRFASWWVVVPPLLALAYAIAVVAAAWQAPDKAFQVFTGQRVVHVEPGGVADAAGLREGDVIIAADGHPVSGTLDYAFRVLRRDAGETLTLGVRRDGARVDVAFTLQPPRTPWAALVATLLATILLGLGLVARIGHPDDVDARRFYRMAVIFTVVYVGALSWAKLIIHPVLAAGFVLALFAGPAIALHLSIDFPHRPATSTSTRWWRRGALALSVGLGLVCVVALGVSAWQRAQGIPDRALSVAVACIALQIAFIPIHTVFGLVAQIRAHRVATGSRRAQLRWLIFGHALGALPVVAAIPVAISDLSHFLVLGYQPFVVAVAVLWFLGYGLAVMRFRLTDVDALIKSSLGYAVTTGAAALVYIGVILLAGWLTGRVIGDGGPWPHLVAGGVAAVLFGPIRSRVTSWVDQRFFRDRQHYIEALRHASESLALIREPAELARATVEQIVDAVRAEGGALYLRTEEGWTVGHVVGAIVTTEPAEPLAPADGIAVPIHETEGARAIVGWLVLGARKSGDLYATDDRDLLVTLASQLGVALANASAFGTITALSRTLEAHNAEIRELRDRLEDENRFLHKRIEDATDGALLVGDSRPMRELRTTLERVARSDASVLVLGESGTGKGLFARTLHASSARAEGPFLHVDCGAIAHGVFESELFGHERGAFTGATRLRRGPIELASGGTLFLDEIGELPLELQPKLLRVLEERCVWRVGASQPVHVDVRIVAATNRDLAGMLARGELREDLYYRLRVVEVTLPPLRARRSDLPALCEAILPRVARRAGHAPRPLAPDALEALALYAWPGNVRELENVLQRALVLGGPGPISAAELDLPARPAEVPAAAAAVEPSRPHDAVMEDIERQRLVVALAAANGNRSSAAKALGIPRTTLVNKLRRHGLL